MRVCLSLVLVLGTTGCLVQGLCLTDEDCTGNESCLAGDCRVECTKDSDCYINGQPTGKECFNYRCQWRLDERVKALAFCLEVVNPKSSYHNKELCLNDLKGKVVLIYFGLLA